MEDFERKLNRIYGYLERNKYDGMVLGRRDNFSWLTGGEESGVVLNTETGFIYLVITRTKRWAVAMRADIDRAMQEQLLGAGFEPCELDWKSISKEEQAVKLLEGGSIVSDIPIEGAVVDLEGIYSLEYPMTKAELARYEEFGKLCDQILKYTADKIHSGMTENEVKRIFVQQCAQYDIDIDVLLIGSDERILCYRHCTPSDKVVEKTLLISPALRKWGLHANLARIVSIGEPDEKLRKRYDDVCEIQAEIIVASKKGVRFTDIFDLQEKLYLEKGYADEWMKHLHGGPIGYMLTDGAVMFDPERTMNTGQAYEWYVTVSGAKSAELVMNIGDEMKVLSLGGYWPTRQYGSDDKSKVFLPDILIL